ncbi:MAG: RNA polymerase sigma-70 factor [Bacteroidales bacterium]
MFTTTLRKDDLLVRIEEAFKYYYRPLNLYANHYLNDIDAAEDVVQECFADLWEKSNRSGEVLDVKSYLYKMVRNRCIDHVRQTTNEVRELLPTDAEGIISDEECEERSRIEARLWLAIDSLPERCREIFLLNKRDGLKYQEVADRMGLSVNTVENQVRKALKVLRDKAEKIYYFFFG